MTATDCEYHQKLIMLEEFFTREIMKALRLLVSRCRSSSLAEVRGISIASALKLLNKNAGLVVRLGSCSLQRHAMGPWGLGS